MNYIDHLIATDTKANAMSALSHLTVADETGDLQWRCGVFDNSGRGLDLVTQLAEWLDDEEPEIVTPREALPGYWAIISLRQRDPAIEASGICKLISDRSLMGSEGGHLVYFDATWQAEFETVIRFEPQIAGVPYTG
jgi:hypothetical protein